MAGNELLDRDRELRAVDALVAQAAEGEARLVLIEGAAGIGKTRLLGEARRRAEAAGMRALAARGSELEREFAFGVVRQLFEPVLGRERRRALAGAAATAEAVFTALAGADTADSSFAALHGLYWLAANLTEEGPLALVGDDLHWCDRASLRFSPTWRAGSRTCRCSWRRACARPSPAPTRRCWPSSPATRWPRRCIRARSAMPPSTRSCAGAWGRAPTTPSWPRARRPAAATRSSSASAPEDSGREYMNFAERAQDVAKFFGTQDAARLRALKARVDPDGTVVANHPV
jgi:AAA ATPase-like protein